MRYLPAIALSLFALAGCTQTNPSSPSLAADASAKDKPHAPKVTVTLLSGKKFEGTRLLGSHQLGGAEFVTLASPTGNIMIRAEKIAVIEGADLTPPGGPRNPNNPMSDPMHPGPRDGFRGPGFGPGRFGDGPDPRGPRDDKFPPRQPDTTQPKAPPSTHTDDD